ncbi:hypothetical protein R1flu_004421 [Riccia fluitans]|uniref:Ribonuclease H n=1 Tax=Riccia fluitans TaxID=41844 RepID=A0ABD1YQ88_9MARC
MGYYAVARGHRPGVYTSWAETKAQVDRFPDARHKKFSSRAEAEAFIARNGGVVPALPNENEQIQASGQRYASTTDVSAVEARINQRNVDFSTPTQLPRIMPEPIPAYYAVAKGRVNGIYSTWAEAEVQVKDLYSAKYKKFYTRGEAEEFVDEYRKLKAVDPNDPHPKNPSTLVAFTDGSAINNGQSGWVGNRLSPQSIVGSSRRVDWSRARGKSYGAMLGRIRMALTGGRLGISERMTWPGNKLAIGGFTARRTTHREESDLEIKVVEMEGVLKG